ncbi:MAG TPA: hypothetical protein VGY77_11555 [Gemmataceae bacterium]|nr:hypothetical protein [Gemmataceae bacterium]
MAKQLDEREARTRDKADEKANQEAVAVADSLSNTEIAKQAGTLKAEVGKLLTDLSDRMEEELNKYRLLKKAVQAKDKELAEIYEIQRSASSLEALIEAQHDKRQEFDTEMARTKEDLTDEIETLRSAWEQEKKRHEAELKDRDGAESKRREREKEEYRYVFAREQNVARDQYEDQKGKLEREIQYRKEALERDLAQREQAIAQRETELESLRKKVEGFPKELDQATARAIKETTDRLVAEAKSRAELAGKEFTGERNVLTTKIEALEAKVAEQNDQLNKLSQRMEKAYGQVQEIAVRAIEGSGITKSLASLQQLLSEQSKRPAQEK